MRPCAPCTPCVPCTHVALPPDALMCPMHPMWPLSVFPVLQLVPPCGDPCAGQTLVHGLSWVPPPMRAPFHDPPHAHAIVHVHVPTTPMYTPPPPPPPLRVGPRQLVAPAGGSAKVATIAPIRTARFGRSVRHGRGRRGSRGGRGRKVCVCVWRPVRGGRAARARQERKLGRKGKKGVMGLGRRGTCDPL